LEGVTSTIADDKFEHVKASLKRLRAVFVGAARNCAEHLPRVLDNLARLSALYAEAGSVFAISDSTDETAQILDQWMANRRGSIVDLGTLELSVPLRTERLAIARNACLDEVNRLKYSEYDHLVVADLDNVMALPISTASFAAAACWLDSDSRRAGAFANSIPYYYDIWSLRHEVWCPHDCWHAIWYRNSNEPFEAAKIREVFARQIAIPRWLPPIRVQSAFGGLGIYKTSYTKGARYKGADKELRQTSEHVQFNRDIGRAGGSLYIFPSLTVQAPPEHLYRPMEFSWWWRVKMYYQLSRSGRELRWQKVLGRQES
jgi:hypothetical protein